MIMNYLKRIFPLIAILLIINAGCKNNKNASTEGKSLPESIGWKVIGPGGGGGVFLPAISPFDENFVFTHCDMTGAYVSYDGGKNWRMFNLWTVPVDFAFDPNNSNTVYAANRGYRHSEDRGSGLSLLYRSEDRGMHWRIIYPDVSEVKKAERLQTYDFLPSELIEGALDGSIDKISVDPANSRRIYLGLSPLVSYIGSSGKNDDSNAAMLVLSTDYGENWNLVAKLPGKKVKAIFPGSLDGRSGEVTVFTESSCVRINESTGKITELPLPVKQMIVVEGGTGEHGTMIYFLSPFKRSKDIITGGVYFSKDWGKSWIEINGGLLKGIPNDRIPAFRRGLAVCESKPEVAYVSITNPISHEDGTIKEQYCIYKTENAGKSWEPVYLASTPRGYITDNFKGSWMERSFDPGWGGSPIDLGVAPSNPDICFAGDNGRGYKTADGGKSWEQVYSQNLPDGSVASGGLDVTTCYGVHFDPFDKDHFFITYTDMGLFHTFNGGKSWFHALNGIPRPWQNTCYWIGFDPEVKGRVWSVWANAHDLPRDKMFGGNGFDRYSGGVAVSDDDGRTWRKSNTGIPENSVCTNILIDPDSPVDSRTLYVSVFDKGVYKSVDGGRNWKEVNNGFGDNLFAWQIHRNSDGRLFVLFSRGKREGNTVDGAVYYSDDNADSWEYLSLPEGVNGAHDLLIDPENTERMYLSCWPRTVEGNDICGGVYKTGDGGATWKQVFDERIRVNSAGLDTSQPNIIFINTFQNAAYRSENSGESWKRIEGYRFKWGQRAIPDIHNPGMLYLTTYGGSVFYGPAAGVPNAFEDIENMPVGWW